jgi:hypothetical protein
VRCSFYLTYVFRHFLSARSVDSHTALSRLPTGAAGVDNRFVRPSYDFDVYVKKAGDLLC